MINIENPIKSKHKMIIGKLVHLILSYTLGLLPPQRT